MSLKVRPDVECEKLNKPHTYLRLNKKLWNVSPACGFLTNNHKLVLTKGNTKRFFGVAFCIWKNHQIAITTDKAFYAGLEG